MSFRYIFVALVFSTLLYGCVSSSSNLKSNPNINEFKYVNLEYTDNRDRYGVEMELSQLFAREGLQTISAQRARRIAQERADQVLFCNISSQSSAVRAVVNLNCFSANERPIYTGSGTYGVGIDMAGDARGATRKAFEGFAEAYTGSNENNTNPNRNAPDSSDEKVLPVGDDYDVDWNYARPEETRIITLEDSDFNPSKEKNVFKKVSEGVIGIRGDKGSGTGFVISKQGLAITSNHVVEGQSDIQAVFRDGETAPMRVLRTSSEADVALIEVLCTTPCTTVSLSEGNPSVGTDIYAIGNPLSLDYTLTSGIISGLRLSQGVTLIQVDAAINPGNSGGPLVNAETGEVVGVVSSKLADEGVEGLGFGVGITDTFRVLGIQR